MNQLSSKRVFIGVKASPEIGGVCFELQSKLNKFDVHWIQPEDLHLTLVSPWQMEVRDFEKIKDNVEKLLSRVEPFMIRLKKVVLGPSPEKPKFVWVITTCSPEFLSLKENLDRLFGRKEERKFLPHITLARLTEEQQIQWAGKNVELDLNVHIMIHSIELFECRFNEALKYLVLESFPFKEDG